MPGWSEILQEIKNEQERIARIVQANPAAPERFSSAPDLIRRKYIRDLANHTGRNVIVYASGWLQKSQLPAEMLMVHPSDLDGFLEAVKASDTRGHLINVKELC